MRQALLFVVFCLALVAHSTWAQIPASLSYQGVLKDSGTPLEGPHNLRFRFFENATGGSHIWSRTYNGVDFTNGVFGVTLENGSPSLGSLAFDKPYWMGVAVDGAADLSPRVPLTASAYSLNTRIPAGAVVTSLNGLKDAVVLEQGSGVTIAQSGNTLTISSTGGGGSGGGSTTIANGSITAAKIADSAVTAAKIASNAVTVAKIASNAVTDVKIASNAVTAVKIATGAVVKELNGFKDNVTIEGGAGITVTKASGNKLTIASAGGIEGTGTRDFLTKWETADKLKASSIFESTSGGIGIATTKPDAKAKFQINDLPATSTSLTTSFVITENGDVGVGIDKSDLTNLLENAGKKIKMLIGPGDQNGSKSVLVTDEGDFLIGTTNIVTQGSAGARPKLQINEVPNGTSSISKSFIVTRDGDVGIGISLNELSKLSGTSPRIKVLIGPGNASQGANALMITDTAAMAIGTTTNSDLSNYKFFVKGTAGGNGDWTKSSDIRLKKNIHTISNALEKVRALRGVSYELKDENSDAGPQVGFVAQEVEPIVPQVVVTNEDGYKAIQYASMVSVLVEAMKEMDAQIQQLNARIVELEVQQK